MKITIIETGEEKDLIYLENGQDKTMEALAYWGALGLYEIKVNFYKKHWEATQENFNKWERSLKSLEGLNQKIDRARYILPDNLEDILAKHSVLDDIDLHIESINEFLNKSIKEEIVFQEKNNIMKTELKIILEDGNNFNASINLPEIEAVKYYKGKSFEFMKCGKEYSSKVVKVEILKP